MEMQCAQKDQELLIIKQNLNTTQNHFKETQNKIIVLEQQCTNVQNQYQNLERQCQNRIREVHECEQRVRQENTARVQEQRQCEDRILVVQQSCPKAPNISQPIIVQNTCEAQDQKIQVLSQQLEQTKCDLKIDCQPLIVQAVQSQVNVRENTIHQLNTNLKTCQIQGQQCQQSLQNDNNRFVSKLRECSQQNENVHKQCQVQLNQERQMITNLEMKSAKCSQLELELQQKNIQIESIKQQETYKCDMLKMQLKQKEDRIGELNIMVQKLQQSVGKYTARA